MAFCLVVLLSCRGRPLLPEGWSWNAGTGDFSWPRGSVTIPTGFRYETLVGGDSSMGAFTSRDGRTVIEHDFGGYAGVWAQRKRSLSFEHWDVEGSRVCVASRDWPDGKGGTVILTAVTFVDAGVANFYAEGEPGGRIVRSIARTFRPNDNKRSAASCE